MAVAPAAAVQAGEALDRHVAVSVALAYGVAVNHCAKARRVITRRRNVAVLAKPAVHARARVHIRLRVIAHAAVLARARRALIEVSRALALLRLRGVARHLALAERAARVVQHLAGTVERALALAPAADAASIRAHELAAVNARAGGSEPALVPCAARHGVRLRLLQLATSGVARAGRRNLR